MMETEKMLVIDGHDIRTESSELDIINDVREVYDANLLRSINSIEDKVKQYDSVDFVSNEHFIDTKIKTNNILITNLIIFANNVSEVLKVNLYKDNEKIFSFQTDENFKVDENIFGVNFEVPKSNFVQYFTDGKTSVLSNKMNNKLLKYSANEIINEHCYTKYYEYCEKKETGLYLLLIDYVPVKLTVYHYDQNNATSIFNYKY